jgi:hypothetical protein
MLQNTSSFQTLVSFLTFSELYLVFNVDKKRSRCLENKDSWTSKDKRSYGHISVKIVLIFLVFRKKVFLCLQQRLEMSIQTVGTVPSDEVMCL